MAYRAPPMTLVCTKCGWKMTIIPSGDAVQILPSCLKCGEGSLTHRAASKAEILMAKLGPLFGR